jgi:glucosamine-6-phosphate deaminase
MKLWVVDSYEEISRKTALYIAGKVETNPEIVLGLATGSSPIEVYRELVEMYRMGQVDFTDVTTFNLDEYYPIRSEHPQSYFSYMKKHLFDHVNININNTHIPIGNARDVEDHCREYEENIKQAGGIDLQLLGIGRNGHIGFNEPGTPFEQTTHIVKLAEETIQDNARFFQLEDLVPTQAITMGIKTIMQSKEILLIANGHQKAEAVKEALCGSVTPEIPASVLQLHPHVTLIIDKDAASLLPTTVVARTTRLI